MVDGTAHVRGRQLREIGKKLQRGRRVLPPRVPGGDARPDALHGVRSGFSGDGRNSGGCEAAISGEISGGAVHPRLPSRPRALPTAVRRKPEGGLRADSFTDDSRGLPGPPALSPTKLPYRVWSGRRLRSAPRPASPTGGVFCVRYLSGGNLVSG